MARHHGAKPAVRSISGNLAAALVAALAACSPLPLEPDRPRANRVGLEEATALVRARIFEESPDLNEAVQAPLIELTSDEMWRRLGLQLFRVTEGVRACDSYLVLGGRAHLLCGGPGGHGIQSACVTDLDGDEVPELTYTWSWGSGIHRSHVGVCRVEDGRPRIEQADLAYVGDLFARKESDSRVVVEIGRYEWALSAWTPEAALGVLAVEPQGDRLAPRIELGPLSEEHAAAIWRQPPESGDDA